ncbi:hypothetical protein [Pleomorphomonas oryzae]|uniref:hypothetical protein n=1 Tax=Pleomorphomonas oryzae TaxID=261934 RepID=UPI00041E2148|nr:hypothetical protein [Pleomorphomonas oryzae]
MRVTAVRKGYFGGKIRDAGEVFDLPDALMKMKPSWVEAAGSASVAASDEPEPEAETPPPADAKPEARKRGRKPKATSAPESPKGNGLTEALGGPPPDWIPGNISE